MYDHLGYIIEKKPTDSDFWQKVSSVPCLDTSYLVGDLMENSDMEFRVTALNAAGQGEPSGASSPVKVKEKIGTSLFKLQVCLFYCLFIHFVEYFK